MRTLKLEMFREIYHASFFIIILTFLYNQLQQLIQLKKIITLLLTILEIKKKIYIFCTLSIKQEE